MKSIKLVIENTYLMGYDENNKACCYYPLTKEAKELDLLLLPPFEEDIEIMWSDFNKNHNRNCPLSKEQFVRVINYKAAQQSNKQFSLEDIKTVIKWLNKNYSLIEDELFEPYIGKEDEVPDVFFHSVYEEALNRGIQSLSTQQLPVGFIPEPNDIGFIKNADIMVGKKLYDKIMSPFKTITNSEGKEELVGNYVY